MSCGDVSRLWLGPIPDSLRARAQEALERRDPVGFLSLASNDFGLELVSWNRDALEEHGMRRQEHMRQARGLGPERIEDHEQLERLEGAAGPIRVRVREQGVVAVSPASSLA